MKPWVRTTIYAVVTGITVVGLLVIGGALFLSWQVDRGQTLPEAQRLEAQAVVDRCSPDYPLKVKRVARHDFITT